MRKYHKINSVFKRDPSTHRFTTDYATDEIAYLASNQWEWTEKVDGTNVRVGWNGRDLFFGGRTDKAQMPTTLSMRLLQLFTSGTMLEVFDNIDFNPLEPANVPVVLFGEGYGQKIQKVGSKYNPDGVDFILFDVWVGGWWLERPSVEQIARDLGVRPVPIVGCGTLRQAVDMTASGFRSKLGDLAAEGMVLRPATTMLARNGRRVIAKLKTKDFK